MFNEGISEMNTQKYIAALMEVGLTQNEAKVYTSLLMRRTGTAAELQKISGVPNSKIYLTVDSLVRQGLCIERRVGRQRIFEVINPDYGFNSIIVQIKQNLEKAETLRKEFTEIYSVGDTLTEPFEYIEIVHGRANVHNIHIQLLRNTKEDFIHFVKPPFAYQSEETKKEQIDAHIDFVNRGGKARWIYEINENSDDYTIESIYMDEDEKDKFRIYDNLPIKMTIFDRETLLLSEMGNSINEDLSMVIIKQRSMVQAYIVLFEYFWEKSMTFDEWARLRVALTKGNSD